MINTLMDFARHSARRYLQSAVFVDDEIFDKRSGMPLEPIDIPTPRKPVYRAVPEERIARSANIQEAEVAEVNHLYHPKDLVSSFAKEGIICALYEPPEEFSASPDSEIFKLCERPDIIILDWDLSGDKGQKALNLIAALVRQSDEAFPHHTRLLSIYTSDMSLVGVANSIFDRLQKEGVSAEPIDCPYRLQCGATRLVIFGKNIPRFGEKEEEFTVEEAQLAKRLIDEFADMNSGILPSYALHGMAAIRENSKRILDRFHGDLNGAFLLHRALSKESEEAFDQLPALLAEELQAVLEEERIDTPTVSKIAADAIDGLKLNAPERNWRFVGGKPFPATRFVAEGLLKNLLINGQIDRSEYQRIQQIVDMPSDGFRGIAPDLMQDLTTMVDSENSKSNHRLAALFSSRVHYDLAARELSYGTIVRYQEPGTDPLRWIYSFCLMPICDSIRLNKTREGKDVQPVRFPFWKLKDDVFSGSNASRRGVALQLSDNSYVLLSAGGKPRDMLWIESFAANLSTGTVKATQGANGRFVLVADGNRELEWVGQLKPLHAQRIAHDIGQNLSRVGLVEAEWLRLLCDR